MPRKKKPKRWTLYRGAKLHEKLGLEPDEHFHPDGFIVEIEGRIYHCLPATTNGKKLPRMTANCQNCGGFFLMHKLELHESLCFRQHKSNRTSLV